MDANEAQTPTPPRPAFTFPASPSPAPPNDQPESATPSPLLSARYRQMKRFARSADKRQSVHMLGSIQHLQRHFMKFGMETAEENEESSHSSTTDLANTEEPPSADPAATAAKPPFPLFETPTKLTPDQLKHEAMAALRKMEDAWRIHQGTAEESQEEGEAEGVRKEANREEAEHGRPSVLHLLKVTTEAIRAVRAWSLVLPPPAVQPSHAPTPGTLTPVSKPRISSISTPSRPSPTPNSTRSVSQGLLVSGTRSEEKERTGDSLAGVRRCALDVLVCLRGMEERFRVEDAGDSSVEEEGADVLGHGEARDVLQRRESVPAESEDLWIFSERTDTQHVPEEGDHRGTWYDRLTASGGYVYRPISREDLGEDAQVISRYLDTVRRTLFPSSEGDSPWRAAEQREHGEEEDVFGSAEVSGEGKVIPEWVDPARWEGKEDQRILAFLHANLPATLAYVLPESRGEDLNIQLLSRLSDGYLLIHAFNAVLRRGGSWGFIPDEDVHDTLAVADSTEEGEGEGLKRPRDWTFRRAGNLRCWGAALKTRYGIPLAFPAQVGGTAMSYITDTSREASPSPSRRPSSYNAEGEGIPWDPVRIAKREEGWDVTLNKVVGMWIDKVGDELKRE